MSPHRHAGLLNVPSIPSRAIFESPPLPAFDGLEQRERRPRQEVPDAGGVAGRSLDSERESVSLGDPVGPGHVPQVRFTAPLDDVLTEEDGPVEEPTRGAVERYRTG